MNRTLYNQTELKAREESIDGREQKVIEGYFIVYDSETELMPGYWEKVKRGAFGELEGQDIRALWNHNHDLVMGRSGNGTAFFREDEHGLWGKIIINENDRSALDAHARVERGDVPGCSFGFELYDEAGEYRDGTYHTEIRAAKLYEVSPCVFPAYPQTEINARMQNMERHSKDLLEKRRSIILAKLRREEPNDPSTETE